MRKIKFRVWSTKKGKMYSNSLHPFNSMEVSINEQIELSQGVGSIWMQFTGLSDKNGKEIYEGDIVKIVEDKNKKASNEPHQFKYGDVAKVEWSNVNLAYYLVNEKLEDIEIQMDYYGAWEGWNWLEIIGNIWEDKHLLKQ